MVARFTDAFPAEPGHQLSTALYDCLCVVYGYHFYYCAVLFCDVFVYGLCVGTCNVQVFSPCSDALVAFLYIVFQLFSSIKCYVMWSRVPT